MPEKGGLLIPWLLTTESWPKAILRGAASSLLVLALATAVEFGMSINNRIQKNAQILETVRKRLSELERVDRRLGELKSAIRAVRRRVNSGNLAEMIKRSQLDEETVKKISELIEKEDR